MWMCLIRKLLDITIVRVYISTQVPPGISGTVIELHILGDPHCQSVRGRWQLAMSHLAQERRRYEYTSSISIPGGIAFNRTCLRNQATIEVYVDLANGRLSSERVPWLESQREIVRYPSSVLSRS